MLNVHAPNTGFALANADRRRDVAARAGREDLVPDRELALGPRPTRSPSPGPITTPSMPRVSHAAPGTTLCETQAHLRSCPKETLFKS